MTGPIAQAIPFDSRGTIEIKPGMRIDAADDGWRGIVKQVVVHTGTREGGNAAGWIVFENDTLVGAANIADNDAIYATGKQTIDFTRHTHAAHGAYHPLYRAMEHAGTPALERIVNCPWSGYIPLATCSDEARLRMKACIEKARELDRTYRPLVALPPLDNRHD